jgi:ferredoxin/flavodoxin---NADP+ reductase
LGPLGHPTEIKKIGCVIGVGGGVGIAEILPVLKAFKAAGNRVVAIIGARTKELLILENECRSFCDVLEIATNDGSYGKQGFVTDILRELLAQETVSLVYAVGPVPMMKKVAEVTRPSGTRTTVSLNPLMVDATGMCGVCRCRVAGKTVFGCVDGPEFNAHDVDFEALEKRLKSFVKEEKDLYGQKRS